MTAEMLDTNDETRIKSIQTPDAREQDLGLGEHESWFASLSKQEKRFHILFYALAGLTGILVVQLIWQIAVLTAQ
jgi:hypothetical protein